MGQAGYWHGNWWATDYWHDDYWFDQGVQVPTFPTRINRLARLKIFNFETKQRFAVAMSRSEAQQFAREHAHRLYVAYSRDDKVFATEAAQRSLLRDSRTKPFERESTAKLVTKESRSKEFALESLKYLAERLSRLKTFSRED